MTGVIDQASIGKIAVEQALTAKGFPKTAIARAIKDVPDDWRSKKFGLLENQIRQATKRALYWTEIEQDCLAQDRDRLEEIIDSEPDWKKDRIQRAMDKKQQEIERLGMFILSLKEAEGID